MIPFPVLKWSNVVNKNVHSVTVQPAISVFLLVLIDIVSFLFVNLSGFQSSKKTDEKCSLSGSYVGSSFFFPNHRKILTLPKNTH